MTNITEHHSEQERESDNREETGVDFLVRCNTVAVHDGLEPFGELVGAMEGWWGLACAEFVQDRRYSGASFLLKSRVNFNSDIGGTIRRGELTVACLKAT